MSTSYNSNFRSNSTMVFLALNVRHRRRWFIKQTVKINGCFFQQFLQQKLSWFLSEHLKMLFLRAFILKPTERAEIVLKNGTKNFKNSPPFEWSACYHVKISKSFKLFLIQVFWKTKPSFKKPFSIDCYDNRWSNFFMIGTFVMKELISFLLKLRKQNSSSTAYKTVCLGVCIRKGTSWKHQLFQRDDIQYLLKGYIFSL